MKIFISYSHSDTEFASRLAKDLERAGHDVWLDRTGIQTGARWDDEIVKGLDASQVVLVLLSRKSTASQNVKDEIGYAVDHDKQILPVLLEACDVPFRLRRAQYIDFTTTEFDDGVSRVLSTLEAFASAPGDEPKTKPPSESEAIEVGLTRLAGFLPERAPILESGFASAAKDLRLTLGPDIGALSPALRIQREESLQAVKEMCLEVLGISFRALCAGDPPPAYDPRPPFPGLFAFRPEDREFYFGRDALIQKLVKRIKQHPFLAVVGASGSGKSSLVMAGLIPALEADMAYFTPAASPLFQLQTAKDKASPGAVFVVDQFEELFTLTHDPSEREEFIQRLLELSKTNRVVVTMRADFWGEVAVHKALKHEMQEHQELIAPMDADELHAAMKKQAETVGLRFDPGLDEAILADVTGEPGAMPLLQHALWMLWKRRHGPWLKAEEYQAFGGIRRAIATTADELYESFPPEDRERMRSVFVRLTRLDESGKAALDTRRRLRIRDLVYKDDSLEQTTDFVRRLANSRLLTTSAATLEDEEVEVAHEALIRNWPRLRSWLDEDRLSLLVQEQIHEAASNWDVSGNDRDAIAHWGGKLEDALHLERNPRISLNMLEAGYLEACKKKENSFGRTIGNIINKWWLPILAVISGLLIALFYFLTPAHAPLLTALTIGTIFPLVVFSIFYRQDKYRIVEIKWVAFCLLGGSIAYLIAAQINPYVKSETGLSLSTFIRFVVPIVETTIEAAALYGIIRSLKHSRMVDGIIYGAAVGTGFAIAENYEYILEYSASALELAIARSFSTNLIHMVVVGLSGLLLVTSRFDRNKFIKVIKILAALTLPSGILTVFNIMVTADIVLLAAVAFGILAAVLLGVLIRRLIKQDEKWIDQILQGGGFVRGSSPVSNVQQIKKTILTLFGMVRASQLERFLILQARRGILQKALEEMNDPKIQRHIGEQMSTVQKKIRGTRGAIGSYCWENVKASIPEIDKIVEN